MNGSGLFLCRVGWRIVAIALLMVGAASAKPYVFPDAWTDLPAADVAPGGELRYYTDGDPRTFNPLVSVEQNLVVDFNRSPWHGAATLAWLRPDDGTLEPRAAESWTVSDDGLSVDVVLRPELRWSDGAPITAQDYLISFQLQSDPATGALGPEYWMVDDRPIELEVTGPMSLQVRFPMVDRFSMHLLQALYPLPDRVFGEAYRSGGADAVNGLWGIGTPPSELVFSGYMRLAGFTPGERLSFERNPYFGTWNVDAAGQPLPYVEGMQYIYLTDDTALSMFLIGDLDTFWPRGLDDIGVVKRAVVEDGLDAVVIESAFPSESLFFLTFNWNLASNPFKQELFRSRDFRRAMAHLVNRADIIELVHSGEGFPLKAGVHPSYDPWFHEELEVPGYDPDRAAELLAGIGLTDRDSSGYLIDAEGRRAGFTVIVVAGDVQAEGTAVVFADAAREVGVDVRVQPVTFPLLVELITASGEDRPFEAVFIGLSPADPAWPLNEGVYSCDGPLHLYNGSGACLSATELLMSDLVKRGRLTLDDTEAIRIAHEVQELEADLSAVIYITMTADHFIASGRLAGHFPAKLRSPSNGFGLPILTSIR